METRASAVVASLMVVILLPLAPDRCLAGESQPFSTDGYWQCQNMPIEKTAYFSQIFAMNAGMAEVQKAFAQLLSTRYGYTGQVNCGVANDKSPTMLAKLKEDHARWVEQLKLQSVKVVETGWMYGAP
jgi:hypothetical protein